LRIRFSRGFWTSRLGLVVLGTTGVALLAAASIFTWYYIQYSRMIDQRLGGAVFTTTSRVFGAPPRIFPGQAMTRAELVAYLQRVGYAESEVAGTVGRYHLTATGVEVRPLAQSYFAGANPIRVEFSGSEVSRIQSLKSKEAVGAAEIEPELITSLFDSSREKRRFVRFADLPQVVVDSIRIAEDKRFFEHPGFDPIGVVRAAWAHAADRTIKGGASTITMQVARTFFFEAQHGWRRKGAETFMSLLLEQRFTKEQIFELYANEVYLGNRGSFAIHGFGEAAQAYFGKDIRELTLAETAFLAGLIRAPNRYANVERHPDRAAGARDRVLAQMLENNVISAAQADAARKAPWHFANPGRDTSAAPYFVDMVRDHLFDRFDEPQLLQQSYRIYTTLDGQLQRAAGEAVVIGMAEVDKQLAKKYERWRKDKKPAQAQVALIALDPRSGEIRALIGGRDYGVSQLNRVLSRRQPGSVFKPFVYAAAMAGAADGLQPVLTPVSTVADEPTTFFYEDKEYSPNNYGAEFHGIVTLRSALRQSLNVATVKVAEMVGYERVVAVARQMGLDPSIKATPAVALGAYEMSPREVAAAYTAFANGGTRAEPLFIRSVVRGDGSSVERNLPKTKPVLDPRVAFLLTNLMEDVVNRGTAAGVRSRGFTAPAAGKTGTSHDGWFAGFTSNLLCVVWVGFDDNRELGLSGASSAAPIWAEFMKRAVQMPGYRGTQDFTPPEGVMTVALDPDTLELATPQCPPPVQEVFLAGTEPTRACSRHGGRSAVAASVGWFSRIFGAKETPPTATPAAGPALPPAGMDPVKAAGTREPVPVSNPAAAAAPPDKSTAPAPPKAEKSAVKPSAAPAEADKEAEKKKGVLGKVFGIFGGNKKEKEKAKQDPAPKPLSR
jgi:penicillin-binding protein 1B